MIIQNKIIYLSGIVMTYFLSELLKTSPIIHKNPRNVQKYEHCINVLSQSVHYVKDVYDMCDTLHVVDDSFNNFTCDLVHLLLYCYALVRNNLHSSLLGRDYWIACTAAVIVYSLITQCNFARTSFSDQSCARLRCQGANRHLLAGNIYTSTFFKKPYLYINN